LGKNEFELFKNWFNNIIIKGVEPEKREGLEKVLSKGREGKKMIYGPELIIKNEIKKNRMEGKMEGKIEGRMEGKIEAILELLEELGNIPEALRIKIQEQKDTAVLSRWHKLAARANSIKEFEEKMS